MLSHKQAIFEDIFDLQRWTMLNTGELWASKHVPLAVFMRAFQRRNPVIPVVSHLDQGKECNSVL